MSPPRQNSNVTTALLAAGILLLAGCAGSASGSDYAQLHARSLLQGVQSVENTESLLGAVERDEIGASRAQEFLADERARVAALGQEINRTRPPAEWRAAHDDLQSAYDELDSALRHANACVRLEDAFECQTARQALAAVLVVLERSTAAAPSPAPLPAPTGSFFANDLGDWASYEGSYFAYHIDGQVRRLDADGNRIPWTGQICTILPIVSYDEATQALNVSSHVALSPDQPGPLQAVLVGEWHLDGCRLKHNGAHGINKLPRAFYVPIIDKRLPVWFNATLRASPRDDSGFEVTTEEGTWGGNESAHYVRRILVPDSSGFTYELDVNLEPWGQWPLKNVRRYGQGVSATPSPTVNATAGSTTSPAYP